MNGLGLLAVGVGATLGAWLRWGLALLLNAWSASLPLGTLLANLIGGYLVGLAYGFFANQSQLAPEWRLFAITGFLGGLTTFSTFSAEAMQLLQRGEFAGALLHSGLHLLGSILFCFAGFASYRYLHG